MKNKQFSVLLTVLFITFFTTAFSQTSNNQITCNCNAAFDFTVKKIEKNYAGFKDKVTPDNHGLYSAFTDSLKLQASIPANQDQVNCAKLIASWIKFFKDRHVGVNISFPAITTASNISSDSVRLMFAKSPKVDYSTASFNNYLKKNKNILKPLEGIWQNETGNYVIGIRYEKNKYTGFVIKADSIYWLPGQIKLEIIPFADSMQTRFYMRDHSLQIRQAKTANVNAGYFDVESIGSWYKLDESGNKIFKDYYPAYNIVNFKRLSPSTNLLTIKSFDDPYRRVIDSIITVNDKLIQSTDNLIIDVRGNGGGSDVSYYPLRKYLFTNPYLRYGAEIYSTDDNIQKFRDLSSNPNFTSQEQERFIIQVKLMEQHLNEYWSAYPPTFTSDTLPVLSMPKRVAVIIDSFCGSTTEQFLLDPVMNSKKTTVYGTHSSGVLDYANITFFMVPNTNIRVSYATSRSKRLDYGKGIDNKGIEPHIKLDNRIPDWVKYAQNDLEKATTR